MPRFFFDFQDSELIRDLDGTELPSLADAQYEAAMALTELARDVLPGSHQRELSVAVREEAGPVLFTAKLSFQLTPAQNATR
jgi:hypothetical protein